MKTVKKVGGFSLVELIIAIALFGIIAIAAYSMLKGSLDASLVGRVQQDVISKAKIAMDAISADLKSSYTPRHLRYPSSVIYPSLYQYDTADTEKDPGLPISPLEPVGMPVFTSAVTDVTGTPIERLTQNTNRLAFYIRKDNIKDGDNIVSKFWVVLYEVRRYALDNENFSCRLVRSIYPWDNTKNSHLGLKTEGSAYKYDHASLKEPEEVQTIIEMPSRNDAIVLYVARALEEGNASASGSTRVIPNQFFVRVSVAQNVKVNKSKTYYLSDNTSDVLKYNDNLRSDLSEKPMSLKRRNIRTGVMESSVTVPK